MLLSFRKKFVVITGTGGLGKTMLMHHLVLTLVKRYDKYQKLPIVIQLKDFDADCTDLIAERSIFFHCNIFAAYPAAVPPISYWKLDQEYWSTDRM